MTPPSLLWKTPDTRSSTCDCTQSLWTPLMLTFAPSLQWVIQWLSERASAKQSPFDLTGFTRKVLHPKAPETLLRTTAISKFITVNTDSKSFISVHSFTPVDKAVWGVISIFFTAKMIQFTSILQPTVKLKLVWYIKVKKFIYSTNK